MANIAVINGCNVSKYAKISLDGLGSAIELCIKYGKSLPDVSKIVILTDQEDILKDIPAEEGIEHSILPDQSPTGLIAVLRQISVGADSLFYFYGDCPLMDGEITKKMYENHIKYFADYTFADGYPYGITPEIIKTSALAMMEPLAVKVTGKVQRDTLFSIIQKDINSFDLETEIAPVDLRLLRVSLICDTKRNYNLTKKISSCLDVDKGDLGSQIIDAVTSNGDVLRTIPSFFNIQVSSQCPQVCSYCPYPGIDKDKSSKFGDFMNLERFKSIIDSIEDFAEDGVISLSLWGEAALNPEIEQIIEEVINRSGLSLIIETSGIGWNPDSIDRLSGHPNKDKISWIVSLDAFSEETYNMMRENGKDEALKTAEQLLSSFKETLWVQAVRTTHNEEDLEQFFRYWKEKTENVIIQKYDWFCGVLKQLKVTDLSPFTRNPCWHIKRDMNILIDGSVPFCREDLDENYILGNILSDSLKDIWAKGHEYYKQHLDGQYNTLCEKCDEYYTYNF